MRTDFLKLRQGGLDVLLSTAYAPEKGIIEECRVLGALRYVMPFKWKKVYARPYFDVTADMLDSMERAVEKSGKDIAGPHFGPDLDDST